MAKRRVKPTKYVLRTSKGVLNEVKFSDYDDDPDKAQPKAESAALRLKDNWTRNAGHMLPEDQNITITEE